MNASPRSFLLAAVLALVGSTALAQSHAYDVRAGGGSRITFTSDAPLETMRGTSSQVAGEFNLDPANVGASTGRITVDIASLRTGIDLRDTHLRSDTWLNAAAFPQAVFELTGASGATTLTDGTEARVTLRGRFTLHGRTRNITASARVTMRGNTLSVRARFRVHLADYGVSIPEIVQLKVAEDITVDVSLSATRR